MPQHTNPSGIRDNHSRGAVADFFREHITDGSQLSFVSAYFTIYAYSALRQNLDAIEHLRFLFGEPRFLKSLDPERTDKKAFRIEDCELKLANQIEQKRVAKDCADWIQAKVEIRSMRESNLLHGKMYHVANGGVEHAIIGSSNFTVRGLGLGANGGNNLELNLLVDSTRDRNDLKTWFDEAWQNPDLVKDVKAEVLLYLEQLYQNHAPEFIYYKTLYHIFESFLAEKAKGGLLDDRVRLPDTQIWHALFDFQKDGVKGAVNKILKHNGCILADSVGLGKTYEALAVIKYFELKNERVLVLCPKKLRDNWTVYHAQNNSDLNPFVKDRFAFTVLCHTDLSREIGCSGDINLSSLNWGNFDLVVIDESHNFRNNIKGKRDEQGTIIRKSRYERLMDDIIKSGVKTKVLLLSATPVNNDLKDLRNQLYFLTEGRDEAFEDTIGVPSLRENLRSAQAVFSTWAKKQTKERKVAELLEKLSPAFFKLLDELTIARSRKHIQRYYQETVTKLGGFPKREKPVSIHKAIDIKDRFLSYDRLSDELEKYHLSLFNPSTFLKPSAKAKYRTAGKDKDPFTMAERETHLIAMMKVNFLKRLESSVHAFALTMANTTEKIETLEEKIRRFQARPEDGATVEEEQFLPGLEDLDDDEREEAEQVGGKFKYSLADIRLDDWLKELAKDKQQIEIMRQSAEAVTPIRDAKLTELKKLIAAKVRTPTVNKLGEANRKVLVFTAFADTATYLYDNLRDWARSELGIHLAMVAGSGDNRTTYGTTDYSQILTHFSPRSKQRDKMTLFPADAQIDLLIATDCISEGQNLQDCDYLVNYDIHWNPVRIIQRFGRIDRIGSVSHTVQMVNFWPTDDLNRYINLKNRVEARMALVDIAATFEDNVLKNEEIEELIQSDLKYRDKQLLRLREEVLDLEDFSESVALNEFTLDDFRIELANYLEQNQDTLRDAPLGLYAVAPAPADYPGVTPGVIFCFRQTNGKPHHGPTAVDPNAVNPLQPYYLAYVRDNGEVRYTFVHPKQILDLLRKVALGQTAPLEALCNQFDAETQNGRDMAAYSRLLEAAVRSFHSMFQRKLAHGLQSGRGFVIPKQSEQPADVSDFELISWLVIKGDK
jgi:SNF2 family DNA or RNA helicase